MYLAWHLNYVTLSCWFGLDELVWIEKVNMKLKIIKNKKQNDRHYQNIVIEWYILLQSDNNY